jgi:hypothetical protein
VRPRRPRRDSEPPEPRPRRDSEPPEPRPRRDSAPPSRQRRRPASRPGGARTGAPGGGRAPGAARAPGSARPVPQGRRPPRPHRRRAAPPPARRGSTTAWLAVLVAASLVPVAIGLATSSRRGAKVTSTPDATAAARTPPGLVARTVGRLPVAVQGAASAVVGPQFVALLGGLDSSDTSRDTIQRLSAGHATSLGTLQTPVHDAAAVRLGSAVYLFGGGQSSSISSIVRLDPATGQTQPAGSLPQPSSSLAPGQRAHCRRPPATAAALRGGHRGRGQGPDRRRRDAAGPEPAGA